MSSNTTLILALSHVYSSEKSYPVDKICKEFPHVKPITSKDDDHLGTCQLFEEKNGPTIGILYTSFVAGRPYEQNPIMQRDVTNLELDFDFRASVKRDTSWQREINLRAGLEDLRNQLDLEKYDDIIFYGTHSKLFNESGSYLQILRRFFVLEENRTLNLNLKVGKKYLDFVPLKKVRSVETLKDSGMDTVDLADG